MRFTGVVLAIGLILAGCGDDDDSSGNGSSGGDAEQYLAELEDAGLGDLFPDDETAVDFVAIACRSAGEFGLTPEEMLERGAVDEKSEIALQYCDTELAE